MAKVVAVAAALIGAATACKAPSPNNETVRIPTVLADAQYGQETVPMTFDLVAFLPDPQYKTDRLDPNRYKAGDLTFSCLAACPVGLVIDALTGIVTWTPSYDQAGGYFINFSVSSGIFSSQKTVPFLIVDVDRPPLPPSPPVVAPGKEGVHLDIVVTSKDPDGDTVHYSCVSCPDGVAISELSGRLTWDPGYFTSGTKTLTIRAASQPLTRPIVVEGLAPDQDSAAARAEIEAQTIDRTKVLTTDFPVVLVIADTPRPPVLDKIPDQSGIETENLSFTVAATDPDLTQLTFQCEASCPAGMQVDALTGVVNWTPAWDQDGKYLVYIDVIKGGVASGTFHVNVVIAFKERPPYFTGQLGTQTGAEGSLFTFTLPGKEDDKEDLANLVYSCVASCPDGLLVAANSGIVDWIPTYDQDGSYAPTFSLSDGVATVSTTINIVIANTDRPPYFVQAPSVLTLPVGLNMTYQLYGQDDDTEDRNPDGTSKLRYGCSNLCPAGLTIGAVTGVIQWLPTYSQNGDYYPSFTVTDSFGESATTVIHLAVTKIARASTFGALINVEGLSLHPLSFPLQAMNADGNAISYACVANCPVGLVVTPGTNTATGPGAVVTWTPTAQQLGQFLVTFEASSSPAWDATMVLRTDTVATITIKKFNLPPTILGLSDMEVWEGGHENASYLSPTDAPLKFPLVATDLDGDLLAYYCSANCPTNLNVDSTTGMVTWVPGYDQAKPNDAPYGGVEFAVTDGEVTAKTNRINIVVHNVDRPPVVAALSDQQVFEMGHTTADEKSPMGLLAAPLSFPIVASSPDGLSLVYTCAQNCPAGLQVDASSGEVTWLPAYCRPDETACVPQVPGNTGALPGDAPYTGVVFAVSDGILTTTTNPINIAVKNVNRRPVPSVLIPAVQNCQGVTDPLVLASCWAVYEAGRVGPSETSAVGAPLSIQLAATDADGDPLTYTCTDADSPTTGCPLGMVTDPVSGAVSWTPAYCNPGETGPSGPCTPQDPTNSGALPGNALRSNIIFEVTDGKGGIAFFNPISVQVLNVDRAAVFAQVCPGPGICTQTVCEGSAATANQPVLDASGNVLCSGAYETFKLAGSDPDGDAVTFSCGSVTVPETSGELLIPGVNFSYACTHHAAPVPGAGPPLGDEYWTFGTNEDQASWYFGGHTEWLKLDQVTGIVTLGQSPAFPVGYYDALMHDAPYTVTWNVSSRAANYPGSTTTLPVRQAENIVIVNVDQPPSIQGPPTVDCTLLAANPGCGPTGQNTCVYGGTWPACVKAIYEGANSTVFSFPLVPSGILPDPDAAYGEFLDRVEYYCDPSGPAGPDGTVDGCPGELTIQQTCHISCSYKTSPPTYTDSAGAHNCGKDFPASAAEQSSTCGGTTKGQVSFNPTYATAKFFNAPYVIKLSARSTPYGFNATETFSSPPLVAAYPPLVASVVAVIPVINVDRPAAFDPPVLPSVTPDPLQGYQGQNIAGVTLMEPCGPQTVAGAPANPCLADEPSPPVPLYMHTQTISLSATDPDEAYTHGGIKTESDPVFTLVGCRDYQVVVQPLADGTCPAAPPTPRLPVVSGIAAPPAPPLSINSHVPSEGCLYQCPAWMALSGPNNSVLTMTPNSSSDAVADGQGGSLIRVAVISSHSCPLRGPPPILDTGWACATDNPLFQDPVHEVAWTVLNQKQAPAAPSASAAMASILETDGPATFAVASTDPDGILGGEQTVLCLVENGQYFGAFCPSGSQPADGDATALANVTPLSTAGTTLTNSSQSLLSATVSGTIFAGPGTNRDRANRYCPVVTQTFGVMACSAATAFNGFAQPVCPANGLPSFPPDEVCSPVTPLTLKIADVPRFAYFSGATGGGAAYKENNPAVITIGLTAHDDDVHDVLNVRQVPGTENPIPMPADQSPLVPSNSGGGLAAPAAGNPTNASNPGLVTNTSFSYTYQNDWSVNGGSGYATRASPTASYVPQYMLCYASATYDGQTLAEQCFYPPWVNPPAGIVVATAPTITIAAPFQVTDVPRTPFFDNARLLFNNIDCSGVYPGTDAWSWAAQDFTTCALTSGGAAKNIWTEYDQAAAGATQPSEVPPGAIYENANGLLSGQMSWSITKVEPADQVAGEIVVYDCTYAVYPDSATLLLGTLGSFLPFGSDGVFPYSSGGRFDWSGRGYDVISGPNNTQVNFLANVCFRLCHKDDPTCAEVSSDVNSQTNQFSPLLYFANSDRPPTLNNINFSGSSGPYAADGDANCTYSKNGIANNLIKFMTAYGASTASIIFNDPDGDMFTGDTSDIQLTENVGSPLTFNSSNGLGGSTRVGCESFFTYRVRVNGLWSNFATLSNFAGHN